MARTKLVMARLLSPSSNGLTPELTAASSAATLAIQASQELACRKSQHYQLEQHLGGKMKPPREQGVIYISGRKTFSVGTEGETKDVRYADADFDREGQAFIHELATVKGRLVLKETPAGRKNIEVRFCETDRHVEALHINHYTEETGNVHPKSSISLYGRQIRDLLSFIETVRKVKMPGKGRLEVEAGALAHSKFVSDADIANALNARPELLREALENPNLDRDLRAIGYWRKGLERFEKLLKDREFFERARREVSGGSAECVWQEFFESNRWIFGYGLLYIQTESVVKERMQQRIDGGSFLGGGVIPDGVLRTQGAVSSLCLVEIKTHLTPLTAKEKRGGCFLVTKDLSDAVSQCHNAISIVEEKVERQFNPVDKVTGFPTGGPIFNIRPRSMLVIGDLEEFVESKGPNIARFRAFEMYRRSLSMPEIITFDELLHRARSIVAQGERES